MELFNRMNPPYKSVSQLTSVHAAQPAVSNGLPGLFGSLFGGATPTYKTADGRSAQAPASSGFWSMFGMSTPSYKMAPAVTAAPIEDDTGDPAVDENGACAHGPDEIVIL
jgi:hypothetical protein